MTTALAPATPRAAAGRATLVALAAREMRRFVLNPVFLFAVVMTACPRTGWRDACDATVATPAAVPRAAPLEQQSGALTTPSRWLPVSPARMLAADAGDRRGHLRGPRAFAVSAPRSPAPSAGWRQAADFYFAKPHE